MITIQALSNPYMKSGASLQHQQVAFFAYHIILCTLLNNYTVIIIQLNERTALVRVLCYISIFNGCLIFKI